MSKAHIGNIMGLQGEYILPVNFEDKLFLFYWNTWSRDIQPTIDVSTIVPDDKFGQVIAVEDGTTNLWTNPGWQDGTLTGWSLYSNGSAFGTYTIQQDPMFRYVLRLEKTDNGIDRWGLKQNKTWSTSGSVLTDSFYIKRISNSPGAKFQLYNDYLQSDASYVLGSGITIELDTMTIVSTRHGTSSIRYVGNGWYYVTFTTTSTINVGNSSFLWIDSNAATVLIAHTQKETKGWATSFVNGTRDVGRVQYPKEIFPPGDFTLNMWIAHTGDTRTVNNSMKIFALDQDVTKSRLTLWNYCPISSDGLNRRIIADFGNNDVGTRQFVDIRDPILFVPHQWEMITVTFTSSLNQFAFYRNGKPVPLLSGSATISGHKATVAKLNQINAVELYNSGWKYSNLLICPRVVPDYEIRAWYDYSKPFYDPYNYTAIYG